MIPCEGIERYKLQQKVMEAFLGRIATRHFTGKCAGSKTWIGVVGGRTDPVDRALVDDFLLRCCWSSTRLELCTSPRSMILKENLQAANEKSGATDPQAN